MPVSYENSKIIFEGIKDAGIKSISALSETWLGLLLQRAEDDPDVELIQVAKEEEAIGIAGGAYFAGEPHVLLMQNHGFLAAINGGCPSRSSTVSLSACSSPCGATGASPIPGTHGAESSPKRCCGR